MRSVLAQLAAVTMACGLAGCGDAPGEGFSVQDSAGVTITRNSEPVWVPTTGWRVAEPPVTEIGGAEGDAAYQLFRVRGAVRRADGVIVVANAGTHQLKFYDENGRHMRDAGRQGGGPGEFQSIAWIGRYGPDSLVVWDTGNRRVAVFDEEGTFVRSAPLNVRGAVTGVFDDGSLLIEESVFGGADGLRRTPSVLWRVPTDGTSRDSLGVFPGYEQIVSTQQVGSGLRVYERSRPFGRRAVFATGTGWFVAGTQDRFELRRYSLSGNLVAIIQVMRANTPVTPSDIAAFKQGVLEGFVQGDPQRIRRELDGLPYPQEMPAFGRILMDDVGHLWVQEQGSGDEQPRWVVFDVSDRMLGTVETPKGLAIRQIGGDFVLGVASNDLDVEHIRMYRLVRN
ncbi:MAG: hypothetical protein WD043_05765 [Gemmatimonadales bacterium]